jgi:hypothetical protein
LRQMASVLTISNTSYHQLERRDVPLSASIPSRRDRRRRSPHAYRSPGSLIPPARVRVVGAWACACSGTLVHRATHLVPPL